MTSMTRWLAVVTVSVLLASAAGASAQQMMAAPDETPLLFDRARAFQVIAVASTAAGFEKKLAPVRGTNSVYLPVKIETVLKGDANASSFRLHAHEQLPALLAQRDANTAGRYLLVMAIDPRSGCGYLGGGMLYKDLERFLPTDAGIEKLVKAFVEANDVSACGMYKLAGALLADKTIAASATAREHLFAVLARLAAKSDDDDWKKLDKAGLKPVLDAAGAQVREGSAVGPAAAVLVAVANRAGNMELDAKLTEPARKWLAAQTDSPAPAWRPEYMQTDSLKPTIELLGDLKDKAAKDALAKIAKESRWNALRRPAVEALEKILSPEEMKELNLPAPPGLPGKLPRPIIRGGPEPINVTDN